MEKLRPSTRNGAEGIETVTHIRYPFGKSSESVLSEKRNTTPPLPLKRVCAVASRERGPISLIGQVGALASSACPTRSRGSIQQAAKLAKHGAK
jgi:hypothetical protein